MHPRSLALVRVLAVAGAVVAAAVHAQPAVPSPSYGPELEGFDYPQPLHHFAFTSQGEALPMAYMDVAAAGAANGRTVVLMHGENFCGATWAHQIDTLNWCATPMRC